MKLSIEVDSGIATYLKRLQQRHNLKNAEETVKFLCEFYDERDDC